MTAQIDSLNTTLSQKIKEFEGYLATLRHCNIEPILDRDAIYLRGLQRYYNFKFKWDKQVFCDLFQKMFKLTDDHTNILLGKYELAEIIGAMACKEYLKETGLIND
jgi:hypothetical protein